MNLKCYLVLNSLLKEVLGVCGLETGEHGVVAEVVVVTTVAGSHRFLLLRMTAD